VGNDRSSGAVLTKEQVEEIDALAKKATPGPWLMFSGMADWGLPGTHTVVPADSPNDYDARIAEFPFVQPYCMGAKPKDIKRADEQRANTELTAALVNAWPQIREQLLASLEERQARERVEKALIGHNEKCRRVCKAQDCGLTTYAQKCTECPRNWVIELPALSGEQT
jgi:hypothetical protein